MGLVVLLLLIRRMWFFDCRTLCISPLCFRIVGQNCDFFALFSMGLVGLLRMYGCSVNQEHPSFPERQKALLWKIRTSNELYTWRVATRVLLRVARLVLVGLGRH